MEALELTNVLIGILILLIGFIGNMIFRKLDKIEKDVQQAAIQSVTLAKDIEWLRDQIRDHEKRIDQIEAK